MDAGNEPDKIRVGVVGIRKSSTGIGHFVARAVMHHAKKYGDVSLEAGSVSKPCNLCFKQELSTNHQHPSIKLIRLSKIVA